MYPINTDVRKARIFLWFWRIEIMKKFLSLVLAMAMMLTLVACGGGSKGEKVVKIGVF